jgi:putative methyltransferase (TIGR04325 family)
MNLTKLIKALCPPILFQSLSKFRQRKTTSSFAGNYASWTLAKQNSSGYDAANILSIIQNSALKVKRGEATFERDSVCFYHVEYRYPALSGLLYAAQVSGGQLSVLDFGGSLASFYFQHAKMLSAVKNLRWGVIEQPHFVDWGQEHLATANLRFYHTSAEFLSEGAPNVIFLSGVLQYMEHPYQLLAELMKLEADFFLFDRTAFYDGDDRLTVQTVPAAIYPASYPAWFLSWSKFLQAMTSNGYEIVMEFPGTDLTEIGYYKGLLFKRIVKH